MNLEEARALKDRILRELKEGKLPPKEMAKALRENILRERRESTLEKDDVMNWLFTVPGHVSDEEAREIVENAGGVFQDENPPIPLQGDKVYSFSGSKRVAETIRNQSDDFQVHPSSRFDLNGPSN